MESLCANVKPIEPYLVLHRGFHDVNDLPVRPLENTYESFDMAVKVGGHVSECDVTISTDGVLFLSHDDDFSRFTDPKNTQSVFEMSSKDFRKIIFKDGSKVAELLPVLKLFKENKHKMAVEIRDTPSYEATVREVIRTLEEEDLWSAVSVLFCFNPGAVQLLNTLIPKEKRAELEVDTFVLTKDLKGSYGSNDSPFETSKTFDTTSPTYVDELIEYASEADGVYIEFNLNVKTDEKAKELIVDLCSRGKKVGVWTRRTEFDNPEYAAFLVSLGVTYVNTDIVQETWFN